MPKKSLPNGIPLDQIAERIGAKIIGSVDRVVTELVPIEEATIHSLAFVRGNSPIQLSLKLNGKKIGAAIVRNAEFASSLQGDTTLLIVDNPVAAIVKLIPLFFDPALTPPGISPKADIDPSAEIGADVTIGAFSTIGAFAKIGDGVMIYPHVTIYANAKIGARSVLHSNVTIREECSIGIDSVIQNGAVIGADGFGYIPDAELGLRAVPQVGNVQLADRVDVGANSCIDRATLGSTRVGVGTKIDNLVQIGHNTVIGNNTVVCGQVGIAGSCTIGNGVVFGGNAGVADHLTVVDGARFSAKAGIPFDITEPGDYGGHPAVPIRQWYRSIAEFKRLPEMLRELRNKRRKEDSVS